MRLPLLGLLLLSLPALAQDVSFRNDREGKSFFYNERKINHALQDFKPEEIVATFKDSIKGMDASKVCAYDINKKFGTALKAKSPRFDEYEGALLFLRHWNELDDVSLNILLNAQKVATATIDAKDPQTLRKPERAKLADMMKAVATFPEKLKTNCYDEAYRNVVAEIKRVGDASDEQLEGLFYEAARRKVINNSTYVQLERARSNDVGSSLLSLKTYLQKKNSLRVNKPLRDANEQSDFVTDKARKTKVSYRIKLYEQYTDLQIMLMADVVKRLRTRLEAKKVTINIEGENEEVEVITLEPMERFRLAIKLLRREMALLATNTYFNGRTPDYFDLVAAAYETSLIPATELKELGGLQEIWNPTKTFWQKAEIWIRTFSSVATVALPQPYGFIPALVLVVIEATVGKGADTQPDETVLF